MGCITGFFCSLLFYFSLLPAAILLGARFITRKLRGRLDVTNEVDISGKTVIVTGASDGVGKATAEEFAVRGARVIMACRNLEKASKAVEEIRKRTGNGELIVMELDLSSLLSVRKFVADFLSSKHSDKGLSILVNNAGVVCPIGVRRVTRDGFEECFGVNHLAHFLLTNLLLPELEKTGEKSETPSRIVIVSSAGHTWGHMNFDDLMYEKRQLKAESVSKWFDVINFYTNSKLANNLFNLELAKRLRAKKVNVNCYALCPGFVETNIGKADVDEYPPPWFPRYVSYPILRFIMLKDAKEGAETTMYCAISKYLEHHSGEMYKNCQFWDYSGRPKLSEEDALKLWEKSEELVGLK